MIFLIRFDTLHSYLIYWKCWKKCFASTQTSFPCLNLYKELTIWPVTYPVWHAHFSTSNHNNSVWKQWKVVSHCDTFTGITCQMRSQRSYNTCLSRDGISKSIVLTAWVSNNICTRTKLHLNYQSIPLLLHASRKVKKKEVKNDHYLLSSSFWYLLAFEDIEVKTWT